MDLVLNFQNVTTIGFISFIFLVYLFHILPSKDVKKGREPPMASGSWPILGHLLVLGGSKTPHKTLGTMANKYGPLFTIKLGTKRALVLSNWEMAKECYTINDAAVSSRSKLVAIEHIAYNQASFGFAPYGSYWREMRKIVSIFLSNRRMEQLSHVRVAEVKTSIKELFHVWSSKKNDSGYLLVEMKQWFSQLVFNIGI
jgi:hypothetical protein